VTFSIGLILFLTLVRTGPYYTIMFGPGYKGIEGFIVSLPFYTHMVAVAAAYVLMRHEIARSASRPIPVSAHPG